MAHHLETRAVAFALLLATSGVPSLVSAAPLKPAAPLKAKSAGKAVSRASADFRSADYRIGTGDVLDITVSNHPEVSAQVTVRPDGKITLVRAGDVGATGKTALGLGRDIQTRLSRSLNNVRVQVSVREARPRLANISGAVKAPGAFAVRGNTRVVDLIGQAGGLSTKASRVTGRVVRGNQVLPFSVAQALAQPKSAANVLLKPDDLVELSAKEFAKQLTVAGEVTSPGTYDLDEDLTVVGLLAQAGGATPKASLKRVHVLRNNKMIALDLSDPNSPRTADFRFRAGDVLIVPENQAQFGVIGQVLKPGFYLLPEATGEATLLKALAQAGGPQIDADLSNATLIRTNNGVKVNLPVNLAEIQRGTKPDDIVLQPGDVLNVPQRNAFVRVIGPVAKPGTYALQDGMTLLSLVTEAGSPTSSSGLSRAYVLREGVQIPVDLRALLQKGEIAPQLAAFRLQRDDILVIPDVREQISVYGQISKPGTYEFTDGTTVTSLLVQAGNFAEDAALSQAFVTRGNARLPLDLRSAQSGQASEAVLNFRFQPGDVLTVPQNTLRYAVIGEVGRSGNFVYPEGGARVTVLDALTTAGGPTPGSNVGADLSKATVVRRTNGQNGQLNLIPVNAKALFDTKNPAQAATANIVMQPGDVLIIPSKGQRGPNAFQSLLSAVPIFGIFAR